MLLSGLPGCGKTTVLRRVIGQLSGMRLAGFYTDEIRQHGRRLGFMAVGLCGGSGVLAHVDLETGIRVSRYGVDLAAFEPLVQAEFSKPSDQVDLFVVDEIGKMECYSPVFVKAVSRVLDSAVPVLATIALKGGGFASQVKARPDVELVTISAGNRDKLVTELAERIRSINRARWSRGS